MKNEIFSLVFFISVLFASCNYSGKVINNSNPNDLQIKLLEKYAKEFDVESGKIKISYNNIELFLSDIANAMDVLISNLQTYYDHDKNNMPLEHLVLSLDENNSIKVETWNDYKYTWSPESPLAQTEGKYKGYVISSGYSYKNELQRLGILLATYETYAEILEQHCKHTKVNTKYYRNFYEYFLQTIKENEK